MVGIKKVHIIFYDVNLFLEELMINFIMNYSFIIMIPIVFQNNNCYLPNKNVFTYISFFLMLLNYSKIHY